MSFDSIPNGSSHYSTSMHPPSYNLKAVLRYDGTHFSGWQRQPNAPTVQEALEQALSQIAQRPIRVHGAGRTDAGVHALGQVCSFQWPAGKPYERLPGALSKMLGPALRMESIAPMPPDFHARYSATGKLYAYSFNLSKTPDPFTARYAWCFPYMVQLEQLRELLPVITGTHDFAGYQCAGAGVVTTTRTLHTVKLEPGALVQATDSKDTWRLIYEGDGFLYKMVRNLTGTLLDIARGKLPPETLTSRLGSSGPYRGYTAPAHGLALVRVYYGDY